MTERVDQGHPIVRSFRWKICSGRHYLPQKYGLNIIENKPFLQQKVCEMASIFGKPTAARKFVNLNFQLNRSHNVKGKDSRLCTCASDDAF